MTSSKIVIDSIEKEKEMLLLILLFHSLGCYLLVKASPTNTPYSVTSVISLFFFTSNLKSPPDVSHSLKVGAWSRRGHSGLTIKLILTTVVVLLPSI